MIVILRRREAPSRRTQNHDPAILAQPRSETRHSFRRRDGGLRGAPPALRHVLL